MTEEVYKYFMEQYQNAKFRVVPGHWPDFQSKMEVDTWIKSENMICDASSKAFYKEKQNRLPDDDDF